MEACTSNRVKTHPSKPLDLPLVEDQLLLVDELAPGTPFGTTFGPEQLDFAHVQVVRGNLRASSGVKPSQTDPL